MTRPPPRRRRRAALVGLALVAAVTAAACSPVKKAAPRARVMVYGDSFILEAQPYVADHLGAAGVEAVPVQFGGIAICDILSRIPADVARYRPSVAVFQFTGHENRPCLAGRAGSNEQKYAEDAAHASALLRDRGVRVLWVGRPGFVGEPFPPRDPYGEIYAGIAAQSGPPVHFDDGPVLSVYDDAAGEFTPTLPCLPHETTFHGCSNGRIQVRSANGHFCPDQSVPCRTYASGAYRYGTSIGAIVLALM